jgi:hypothetical protein
MIEFLREFRWYRALIGGCWERWFTPSLSKIWVPVEELTDVGGPRPHHWCRGTPTQEWYP